MYLAFDLALEDGSLPATSLVGFTKNPGTKKRKVKTGVKYQRTPRTTNSTSRKKSGPIKKSRKPKVQLEEVSLGDNHQSVKIGDDHQASLPDCTKECTDTLRHIAPHEATCATKLESLWRRFRKKGEGNPEEKIEEKDVFNLGKNPSLVCNSRAPTFFVCNKSVKTSPEQG